MKNLLNKLKLIGWTAVIYTIALNLSFSQTNINAGISAMNPSKQLDFQLLKYETNMSKVETNIMSNPNESSDKLFVELSAALKPLHNTMESLTWHQSDMSRREKARLWFEVLAAVDRHYDPLFISTNAAHPIFINGWISPPPGYKGKVGLYGMLPPDTNDLAAYSYYTNAVNSDNERRKKMYLQHDLERINEEATSDIKGLLQSYSSSDADKQEFEELIRQSSLSDVRKQELQDYFNKVH